MRSPAGRHLRSQHLRYGSTAYCIPLLVLPLEASGRVTTKRNLVQPVLLLNTVMLTTFEPSDGNTASSPPSLIQHYTFASHVCTTAICLDVRNQCELLLLPWPIKTTLLRSGQTTAVLLHKPSTLPCAMLTNHGSTFLPPRHILLFLTPYFQETQRCSLLASVTLLALTMFPTSQTPRDKYIG